MESITSIKTMVIWCLVLKTLDMRMYVVSIYTLLQYR